MKIHTAGHRYELASFEGTNPQTIQFIEKTPVYAGATELVTVNDGTTNEEVLAALIDRMQHLNAKLPSPKMLHFDPKFPSPTNDAIIAHLEQARLLLNYRTAERKARNVEGKHLA